MKTDDPYKKFSASSAQRRNISVAQLAAPMAGYEWIAILKDAYLTQNGVDVQVPGFRALLGELSDRDAISRLDEIRRSGYLTEGARGLPQAIVDCLIRSGKQPCFLRPLGSFESQPITAQQMTQGMWPSVGHEAGEIEICDIESSWYLRVRDDDPLSFLYANTSLVEEIERVVPEHMIRLPEDFVYAY